MNAPEMFSRPDFRLNRIKVVSRIANYVCFAVLIFSIGFFIWRAQLRDGGAQVFFMVLIQAGLWGFFWKLRRLPHFKDQGRLAAFMVLLQLLLWIGYWKLPDESPSPGQVWHNWFWILYQISMWFWYWKLARLFGFYERGLIFAEETIRCIKILGLLCVIGWLLGTAAHLVSPPARPGQTVGPPRNSSLVQPPIGMVVATNDYPIYFSRTPILTRPSIGTHYLGFFSFDLGTGINFGPFCIGVIIILIAWIMEEGRKIQEEQELTV